MLWCLPQKSLPNPGFVLGWLSVRQHERVYCRDSVGWASSSVPLDQSCNDKALIKWTSALPCTISVTVQPTCLICCHNLAEQSGETDLKHLLVVFQTAYTSVKDQTHRQVTGCSLFYRRHALHVCLLEGLQLRGAVCLCMGEQKTIDSPFPFFVAGKYGSEIRPAFWLNFFFLLTPVWGAVTLFSKPKDRPLIGGYNVSPTHQWNVRPWYDFGEV